MELLIDSHAHLTDEAFESDLSDVLERAAQGGIDRVVTVAESFEDARRAAALAGRFDMVASTAGVHPHRADTWSRESARQLAAFVESEQPVAIGEIGLDYHYDFSSRNNQQRAFREQLRLAKELALPVIVHCRKADEDLIEILETEGPYPRSGVVHCFNGTSNTAARIVELGLSLGIGGMVTFRNAAALREVVRRIPLDRLLVETDSPYLAPEPLRGQRNEPAYVRYVAEKIAEVRSVDVAEIASRTRRNAIALFGLSPESAPPSMA